MIRSLIILPVLFTLLTGLTTEPPLNGDPDALCSHLKTARAFLENPPSPTRNQLDFDVKYYDLDLQIYPDSEIISGSLGVLMEALTDNLDHIELDFSHDMTVYSVTDTDGGDLSYSHSAENLLDISLPTVLSSGETAHIIVNYGGTPTSSGFGSFGFSSYSGEHMIWTLSEPYGARDWWPCKDTPTDKADSLDVSVRVPGDLIVASNGLLTGTEEIEEWTTYHWQERYPISTYLVSLAIYPYTQWTDWYVTAENDSMPIQHYVFPNHYIQYYENYDLTDVMIGAMAERFGEYPFFEEKYGHAEFVWGGGMEHQTMTSMGGYSEHLISHELAHQWWGDMVTCGNFHHIWINEGFATYGQAMWYEMRDNSIESLHDEMWNKRYLGAGTIYVADTTNTGTIFSSSLSYNKASWVLHMLRHIAGDELFFAGLREYGERYRFSHAVTEDFQGVMEDVTGLDLEAYFQRWIYGEYYPIYVSSPQVYASDDSWFLQVEIEQIQTSNLFEMPVDVKITTTEGSGVEVIYNDAETQIFGWVLGFEPLTVELDPDNWILSTVQNNSIQDMGYVLTGDANEDGTVDVLDVILMVNVILVPESASALVNWISDINGDGIVDVLDVVQAVSIILGLFVE